MTDVILIALFIILIIWDVYLYTDDVEGNTISQVVRKWSKKYPSVVAFLGFLLGHFIV